jgi:hypothetical protein
MAESEALSPSTGPPSGAVAKAGPKHRKRSLLVVHPLLFGALPVLTLWAGNIREGIPFRDVVLPLAAVIGGTLVVFAIATLLLKSAGRGGMVASILVVAFFTYGQVFSALEGTEIAGVDLGRHLVLLPLWTLLALGLVTAAARARKLVPELTSILNVVAAGLVVLNVWLVVSYQLDAGASEEEAARLSRAGFVGTLPTPAQVLADKGSKLPDIYYLVFEEYAGEQTMRDVFHYDNTPFLRQLEQRGFFVPHDSTTNYPRTNFSLASSLNMEYLGFMSKEFGKESDDAAPLTNLIQYSRVVEFLKSVGYKYWHIGSWWQPTARAPLADENVRLGGPSEFVQSLGDTTVLQGVNEKSFRGREYGRIPFQFKAVAKTAELSGPTFVFGHFLVPHGPYVFNPDGSYVTPEEAAARTEDENYVNQVEYANSQILKAVDGLMDRPVAERPVIIVQADEGPFEGQPTTWTPSLSANLSRKFPILNAYYLPGKGDGSVTQDATPVNTFRVVLNLYFGADLEVLPQRNFVFRSLHKLYDFTDVTDLVRDSLKDGSG